MIGTQRVITRWVLVAVLALILAFLSAVSAPAHELDSRYVLTIRFWATTGCCRIRWISTAERSARPRELSWAVSMATRSKKARRAPGGRGNPLPRDLRKILRLRWRGFSLQEFADEMGCIRLQAHRLVQRTSYEVSERRL
jgi:hypothetical protein